MIALLLLACATQKVIEEPEPLDRLVFNQRAVERGVPIYEKVDGTVVTYRSELPFDGDLEAARSRVLTPEEPQSARIARLREELAQGRVTLVETDLSGEGEATRTMVRHLLEAAAIVEDLYQAQRGVLHLKDRIEDPTSRAVFERNQGPWCEAPKTRDDPECSALSEPWPRTVGIYPRDVQTGDFCKTLPAEVRTPFVVATREGGAFKAVPYTERWPDEMKAASEALLAAAAAAPPEEAALKAYLEAAAKAFVTNDWFAADEAWAAMDQENSEWYVRVGPDEVYWDPCAEHAGFHMTIARVSPAGLAWQEKLSPVKRDMEEAIAALAGAPYTARTVGFDLPEFIEIVLNAGDDRAPRGATVGQSLPNWGPVAEAGGRTVAMTNIGTDPAGIAANRRALSSLFCPATMALWPEEPEAQLITTILHEAAHNLGPSHEYEVDGQTDEERFGGPMASMLEELKAQSGAFYLTGWLAERGLVEPDDVISLRVGDVAWGLGKIAEGMYDGSGTPLAYPQLAAIQIGTLVDAEALAWEPEALAANGTDTGCLELDAGALPAGIEALAREVLQIKATGDKSGAEALVARYVDGPELADLHATVAERMRREPDATYVYRVILE